MIETTNLGKCYRIYRSPIHRLTDALHLTKKHYTEFWALRDTYLSIQQGASFGIIGPNGAGKSTLLKLLSGITQPSEGSLNVNGTVASILELGTGFHPEFSGRNNVYLNCALQGFTREETDRLLPGIIEFSELNEFIERPVREYSTGMYLRLAFAVATEVDPDVLIVDEALAVGDEHFRNKCLDRMNQFKERGKTVLFVSHDLATVRHFCTQVALLNKGKLIACGTPDEVLDTYLDMVHENKIDGPSREQKQETSPRWGSGEIHVDSVKMFSEQTTPNMLFDTNAPIRIDATFTVNSPVEGIVFGYQIFRSDGVYINGTNHFWHKTKTTHDFDKVGYQGTIRCEIPRLPLLPGQYYLTMCCYNQFDAFPQAVDHWERCCQFAISERETDQHGIVSIDTDWNLTT